MPILNNAKKALRVAKRKTDINQRRKSKTKKAIDAVKQSPTADLLAKAYQAIDRAAKHNLFHKNKAARLKSQLAKVVKTATA